MSLSIRSPIRIVALALALAGVDGFGAGAGGPQQAAPAQEGSPPPQVEAPVTSPVDLQKPERINERLAVVNNELQDLGETDPLHEEKRSVLVSETDILQRQLRLLEDHKRLVELAARAAPENLEASRERREKAQRSLAGVDVQAELTPLYEAATDTSELQRVFKEQFEDPFERSKSENERVGSQLQQLVTELATLPNLITQAKEAIASGEAKITELEKLLQESGAALEAPKLQLATRRVNVYRLRVAHQQLRTQYLEERRAVLMKLIDIYKLEKDAADSLLQRERLRFEAARTLLQELLNEASRRARNALRRKKEELRHERDRAERLFKEEEVAVQKLEAEHKARQEAAAALRQRLTELKDELQTAWNEWNTFQRAYSGSQEAAEQPVADMVARTIDSLQKQTDRSQYFSKQRRYQDELGPLLVRIDLVKKELEGLNQRYDKLIASAKAAHDQAASSANVAGPSQPWRARFAAWNQLRARKHELLKEEQDLLSQMTSAQRQIIETHDELFSTRRKTLLLLRKENLFLRGKSQITWDSLSAGLEDLSRLPLYVRDAFVRCVEFLTAPRQRGRAAVYLAVAGAALGLLFFLRRRLTTRLRSLLAIDLTSLPARMAVTATVLARAACVSAFVFLVLFLPAVVLHGISPGVADLLPRLALLVAAIPVCRSIIMELFRPQPRTRAIYRIDRPTANRAWLCLSLLLYASVLFAAIDLSLFHLNYPNEGAIEFIWVVYEVFAVVVLLALIIQQSLIRSILPSSSGPIAGLVRFFIRALYPVVVLMVPAMLVLDLLKFDYLAGLITTLSITVLAALFGGYVLYNVLCFTANRWVDLAYPRRAEDEEERDEHQVASVLVRVALRFAVFFCAVLLVYLIQTDALRSIKGVLDSPLPFQGFTENPVTWWNVSVALVLFVLVLTFARYFKMALQFVVLRRTRLDSGTQYAIAAIAGYTVVGLSIYILLANLFDLQKLGYLVAALTVGIGFGLQEIVSNFVCGLILLLERPLKVGDTVRVGNTEGVVRRINIRSTLIQTLDNISILVPNKDLITKDVVNYVYGDAKLRIEVPVGVEYGSDTALVRKALYEVAETHGLVLKRPAPEVRFVSFGDSSLNFSLLVWVANVADRFRVASDLTFAVDAACRRHDVVIAFPQRDLHLKSAAPIRVVHEQAVTNGGAVSASRLPPDERPKAESRITSSIPGNPPTADSPPADSPRADSPPADSPPADSPPADSPPFDSLPVDRK